jgi:OOP family OmpA-OmpF porin
MKRRFALLLTLSLLFLLSYFCFINKSPHIKHEILKELNNTYATAKMEGVKIRGLEGSNFRQTRTVILEGTVHNQQEREEAKRLAQTVKGVSHVKNYLTIPYKKPDEKTITKMIKKENPAYIISISKSKGNKVVIIQGFISNEKEHKKLILEAQKLFGKVNIIDELEEGLETTTQGWYENSKLGIEALKTLEYGHFEMMNKQFKLQGYIQTAKKKSKLLKYLNKNLNPYYVGDYNILTTPIEDLCQTQIDHLLSNNKIYFQPNSASIKKTSHPLLNQLTLTLKNTCLDDLIVIEGHTDSKGKKAYNLQLSTKRAKSVKSYLIKQGIQEHRIEAIGYGESQPIASNKSKKGQKQNRRIEFKIKTLK